MSSLVVVHSTKQCQQCKSTYSVLGRYLKDHVISSENARNIGMCYVRCSKDQRCKSINFLIGDLLCELNDADRHTHPWDYVLKKNHLYSDYPVKVCVCVFTNFITALIVHCAEEHEMLNNLPRNAVFNECLIVGVAKYYNLDIFF